MHDIFYLDAALGFAENMLVMPEAVRTETLLVNEQARLVNVTYLCNPINGKIQERTHAISYYHSGVHLFRNFGCDSEVHPRRRNQRQVARVREEVPRLAD